MNFKPILLGLLFVVASFSFQVEKEYASFDGWYNNALKGEWGSAEWKMSSRMFPAYGDGVYNPAGQDRTNPVAISEALFINPNPTNPAPSDIGRTALSAYMGQHVWHEILDMFRFQCSPEAFWIPIPPGDPFMDPTNRGDMFIPFWRAKYDIKSGQSPMGPRMPYNDETSWIDGSSIYGVSGLWNHLIRSHVDGKLECSDETCLFPALNAIGLPIHNPPPPREHAVKDSRRLFKMGNRRGNENPAILALQILWFREHNSQATRIKNENPGLNDEQIFNLARQFTVAELQHIMLDEWLPSWMGVGLPAYTGYSTSTPPGVTTEFSIAFRYGETLIGPGIYRRESNCIFNNFTPPGSEQSFIAARLCNLYWNAQDIFADGSDIDQIIMGLASQIAEREDHYFTEDIRQFTYGPLEFSRRDLMAIHIQRGRDYGLPDYNTARFNYDLIPLQDFSNLTSNTAINEIARELYRNNISNVDMFVGGMLECDGGPGELWVQIFIDVLIRIRNGDRFWFENTLTGFFNETEIFLLQGTTFKDIIVRNTKIPANAIQNNPFVHVNNDVCPQPKQLAPQDMEPCTPLLLHDYFSISYAHIPLVATTAVIYILLVFLIMYLFALKRSGFKLKLVADQINTMTDTTSKDGTKLFAAIEEYIEEKVEKHRAVYLGVKKGKLVVLDEKQKSLREIQTRLVDGVVLCGTRQLSKLLIQIPKEYDVFVSFADPVRRNNFWLALKSECKNDLMFTSGSERHVQSISKTKDMRKKEMKKFFNQAIKALVAKSEVQNDPSLFEQELSKDEFAEAFSIPKGSLFVQQLFSMVDKDNSGYVSFREFLDFLGIFYNGSSEAKLTFLFDLYDTEKRGQISRESFAKMLKANMEMANQGGIPDKTVNEMVDQIFKQLGLGPNENIKFNDFKEFMGRSGKVITVTMPGGAEAEPKKKGEKPSAPQPITTENFDRGATFFINQQLRDNLANGGQGTSSSLTVLFTPEDIKKIRSGEDHSGANPLDNLQQAYSASAPKDVIGKVDTDKSGSDLTTKGRLLTYIRDNKSSIFILIVYVISGALVFGERAYTYSVVKEHGGLRKLAGFGVTTTRGAASAMMFNFSLLLATMTRNIFTKVRSGKFFGVAVYQWIPFDNIYIFHKLVALIALFWTGVHIFGHFINFFHINTQPTDNLKCVFRDVYHLSFDIPSFSWWLFATLTGFSGFLLILVIVVMYVFSSQYARRHVYVAFWSTHHVCAILLYALLTLHGSARLVQQPGFYMFFLPPASLFVLDRLLSFARSATKVPVVEADLLPSGVTKIVYRRPDDFDYKAGQWIRIACLAISSQEFHSFTISSAPHEKHLTCHIRAVGPWTRALREVYDPKVVRLGSLPELFIDGPYGEGHQDWNSFEVCVLVGGGIGVTPFAGILKDVVHQIQNNRTIYMRKCYFFWVCRNQKQFEWLVDIIRECEEKDPVGVLEVHIFITELQNKHDLRTTMLHVCESTFVKVAGKSLFTGCRARSHFGRPNFDNLFQQLQQAHKGVHKIGVFSCGPPAMTLNVDDGAKAANKRDGPRFHHHFENF